MKCDECIHSGVCKLEPPSQYPEYMKRLTCTTCKHFVNRDSKGSNAKLKELLQKAVDDFRSIAETHDCLNPDRDICADCELFNNGECTGWRYESEAMKLITKDGEQK